MKTHPTYPLQKELTEAIAELLKSPNASNAKLLHIRETFECRRDTEFPGWRAKYDAEMRELMREQAS